MVDSRWMALRRSRTSSCWTHEINGLTKRDGERHGGDHGGGHGGGGRRLLSPPNIPSIRRSARRWGRAHRWGGSSRQPWRATCAKTRTGAVAAGRSGGSRCSCVLRESGRNFWKGAGLGRAAGIACGVLRDVMQCGKRVLQWPTTAGVPRRMGVFNVGWLTLAPQQHQKDARFLALAAVCATHGRQNIAKQK